MVVAASRLYVPCSRLRYRHTQNVTNATVTVRPTAAAAATNRTDPVPADAALRSAVVADDDAELDDGDEPPPRTGDGLTGVPGSGEVDTCRTEPATGNLFDVDGKSFLVDVVVVTDDVSYGEIRRSRSTVGVLEEFAMMSAEFSDGGSNSSRPSIRDVEDGIMIPRSFATMTPPMEDELSYRFGGCLSAAGATGDCWEV